jgi:hypothetical protein
MSTPIYLKTGVQFIDYIVVQDPTGAFVTGLTNASFTKQLTKTGVGNQATTGITVTEVDSVNNPGVYSITLATTGFVSANGSYHLKLYRTSDPTYSYEQIYEVTYDGTPSGVGALSFTSSSGNGRIVDSGASPISGATVYITQTSSGYQIALPTDVNGDWGPWFQNPSAGTFVITANKTGYAQTVSSISVGALSITGPGTNIVLQAVSSSSAMTAGEWWSYARRQASNKSGTQADTKIKQLVNDAQDRLAKDFKTSQWYWRRAQININAAYDTGTITLTNGSANVVIAGGTWPSWAGSAKLRYNNQLLDIESRTDGTTVVLTNTWNADTVAGAAYVVFQDTYDLPENFFEFGRIMQGQAWPYQPDPISIQQFWQNQNAWTFGSQYSWSFAIANGKLLIGPYPNTSASYMYTMRVRPTPLVDESDVLDVDPGWTETLRHLVNYYVCMYFGESVAGTKEQCLALYQESLQSQLSNDKSPTQGAQAGGRWLGRLPMWATNTTPFP